MYALPLCPPAPLTQPHSFNLVFRTDLWTIVRFIATLVAVFLSYFKMRSVYKVYIIIILIIVTYRAMTAK